MTATVTADVERIAARAALAVPGVVELQPTLRQSLAGAATSLRQALGSPGPSPDAGIRVERTPHSGAWNIEVRCVLDDDRRALDTARDVHDTVRAAVASHAAHHGTPAPVTIAVTVIRIKGPRPSCQPGATAP